MHARSEQRRQRQEKGACGEPYYFKSLREARVLRPRGGPPVPSAPLATPETTGESPPPTSSYSITMVDFNTPRVAGEQGSRTCQGRDTFDVRRVNKSHGLGPRAGGGSGEAKPKKRTEREDRRNEVEEHRRRTERKRRRVGEREGVTTIEGTAVEKRKGRRES